MNFGLYLHIPYCLQRCPYCDFSTYEQSQIPPIDKYVDLLCEEIRQKQGGLQKSLDTIYFGGGTPSLLEPKQLSRIFSTLKDSGFIWKNDSELTIEINPATLDPQKIESFLSLGINRFSIGSQTFNDILLERIGRKHSAQDTVDTINLLKSFHANFSLDLLFALPDQTMEDLKVDLETLMSFRPNHVSPYCLTIKDTNPLNKNRPSEQSQVEMFDLVEQRLNDAGLFKYEISNFSTPGYESKHNLLYWQDDEYIGLGLSSHSYLKTKPWGTRFWNPKTYANYEQYIISNMGKVFDTPFENLPPGKQKKF